MALRVKIIATDSLSGTLLGMGKNVLRLGVRFAKMGILAATAISAIAIKLQKDLDKGIREIGTLLGGLTDNQIKAMTQELERLAAQSGQAITALTKARYDIVSAGFNQAADAAELLNQSAILAVGGVTEVSTAADLLTTALNAYSKSAQEAADVSDILFTTVRLGKTTITELGGSMGRLLAITGQMDISLVEVGAALATLTAGGQNTAEAVTAIRASVIELIKPQTDLEKLIKNTAFETTNALLASEGYAGALKVIKEEADKAGIPMTELFSNVRAMQAVLPLTGIAFDKFAENITEFEKRSGAAADASAEMQKSFEITVARLRQNVNNMLRSLGRNLIDRLQPRIAAFNKAMESMGEIDWGKVSQILINNWTTILLDLGKIAFAGGKIVGIKLMDAISDEVEARWPIIAKTFSILGGIIGGRALVMGEKTKESADRIAEARAEIQAIVDAMINRFIPAFSGAAEVIEEFNKKIEETPSTIIDIEEIQSSFQKFLDWYESEAGQRFIDTTQQITNAVGDIYTNFLNLRRAQIQSELETQIGAVLASGLAEEEKQAKISNLREEARRKEIAAAKALKPIKIAQAISGTALAVINALSTKPVWLGIAMAALVGAAGAAEIATIAAQPFAHGGFVKMGGSLPASDTIPAMLSKNEIVSTAAASERFGAEISRLNQLAESGFGGGGGDALIVNTFDPETFADAVRRNPNKYGEAFQILKDMRFIR